MKKDFHLYDEWRLPFLKNPRFNINMTSNFTMKEEDDKQSEEDLINASKVMMLDDLEEAIQEYHD